MDNIFTEEVLNEFRARAPELSSFLDKHKDKMKLKPRMMSPPNYLIKAIIYQQLSLTAANAIETKFMDLFGNIDLKKIVEIDLQRIRECGMSRSKCDYVKNIAASFLHGELTEYRNVDAFNGVPSREIVRMLTSIKGVGPWTAHMFLIFNLGRIDVLANGDLGVRKGFKIMYNLEELPKPKDVKKLAKPYKDYATVATFLSWRVLGGDEGNEF